MQGNGRGGRPHALQLRVGRGVLEDSLVRDLKSHGQRRLHIVVRSISKDFLDGFHRYAAGFLSAFVTAHTVGHNGQSAFAREFLITAGFPVRGLVFVIFSLAANVAEAGQVNSGPYSHYTFCVPSYAECSESGDYIEPCDLVCRNGVLLRHRDSLYLGDICHRMLMMNRTGACSALTR